MSAATKTRRTRPQRGSEMSTKQLARTVLDGRQVDFFLPDGEMVTGYVAGMDDYHWLVVSPDLSKTLVHKGSAFKIDLWDNCTYDSEPRHLALEGIIRPFRIWVERDLFGRQTAATVPSSATPEG